MKAVRIASFAVAAFLAASGKHAGCRHPGCIDDKLVKCYPLIQHRNCMRTPSLSETPMQDSSGNPAATALFGSETDSQESICDAETDGSVGEPGTLEREA